MSRRDLLTTGDRRGRLGRVLSRLEVDRAVIFVLAARFWQLAAGPVTLVLIAARFSQETQGFYYTFGSLTALQSFVELGLHMVLLNLVGHAWSGVRWDEAGRELAGDEAAVARFRGLDAFARRWYGAAAVVFAVAVGAAGEAFFRQSPEADVRWRLPWWALVVLTAASLRLMPSVTLLEGCGYVAVVNRYRLLQAVCGNLVVWPLILAGAELWVTVAAAAVKLAGEVLLTRVRFGRFLAAVRRGGARRELDWRNDVWPLQWRAGLQSLFLYFSSAVFIPIVFHYRGPEEAGRLGMTWTVLSALQSAAFGWAQTRVPRLAVLAAGGEHGQFDRLWRRVTLASSAALAAGGAAFVAAIAVLNLAAERSYLGAWAADADRLAGRLLTAPTTAVFAVGVLLWHVLACETVYIRAYRVDPLVRVTVTGNLLIGAAAWLLGRRFGSPGTAAGYLLAVALFLLPATHLIWQGFRRRRGTPNRRP